VHRRLESLRLNDEPNFRCQCGSNVVWSRY
jgi:hypothetical protein